MKKPRKLSPREMKKLRREAVAWLNRKIDKLAEKLELRPVRGSGSEEE